MLISAFFPKLMEKLKHGSMLLRTEESVRFPGLGERTKRWRNYYLESQLMSTASGDERKVPALEPGPQHLLHFSRKAHPAFRSGQQRCLESRLVEWRQQDKGPPLSTGFTLFLFFYVYIFLCRGTVETKYIIITRFHYDGKESAEFAHL